MQLKRRTTCCFKKCSLSARSMRHCKNNFKDNRSYWTLKWNGTRKRGMRTINRKQLIRGQSKMFTIIKKITHSTISSRRCPNPLISESILCLYYVSLLAHRVHLLHQAFELFIVRALDLNSVPFQCPCVLPDGAKLAHDIFNGSFNQSDISRFWWLIINIKESLLDWSCLPEISQSVSLSWLSTSRRILRFNLDCSCSFIEFTTSCLTDALRGLHPWGRNFVNFSWCELFVVISQLVLVVSHNCIEIVERIDTMAMLVSWLSIRRVMLVVIDNWLTLSHNVLCCIALSFRSDPLFFSEDRS